MARIGDIPDTDHSLDGIEVALRACGTRSSAVASMMSPSALTCARAAIEAAATSAALTSEHGPFSARTRASTASAWHNSTRCKPASPMSIEWRCARLS